MPLFSHAWPHIDGGLTRLPWTGVLALGLATLACAKPLDARGTLNVPAGPFQMGSTVDERAVALELSYAAHEGVASRSNLWLKGELEQSEVTLPGFRIMKRPVTQEDYFIYARTTGAAEPYIDPELWATSEVGHPYALAEDYLWHKGAPAPERVRHPVVLVNRADAQAYCAWWGQQRNGKGRLPSEAEWEKAARGDDGQLFPWGDRYDQARLNASDSGANGTMPVGAYPESASPYGMEDAAGNVFEWTRTDENGLTVVKGGSWNADGAMARGAARHLRPPGLRHVVVGFRCVLADPDCPKHGRRRCERRKARALREPVRRDG